MAPAGDGLLTLASPQRLDNRFVVNLHRRSPQKRKEARASDHLGRRASPPVDGAGYPHPLSSCFEYTASQTVAGRSRRQVLVLPQAQAT
jgi:hypothetical protein